MVPLIITMDLEIAKDHDINEQNLILEKIKNDFQYINTKFTTFTTSEATEYFPEQIKSIHSSGNEIGCHGLNHGKEESYNKLTKESISNNIRTSTKIIENLISESPKCFRGPGMSTSCITQNELINNGYTSDFSVCPQRIDFLNTKGGDIRWLYAPRSPYKASKNSPFSKGNLPLWVIPLSCAGFPFISGMLYILGLNFMKIFFQLLLKESLRTKKPIVYLFHSYEFSQFTGENKRSINNSDIDRNKRSLIHYLYINEPVKRYNLNLELIKYMLSFEMVKPFNGNEYTELLNVN